MTRTNGNGKTEKRGESKSAKARRLAAERMAAAVERVRLNQADLETVLAGAEQIAEAERRRDRMIARARRDFAEAEAKAQRGIGQAITAWRARGESEQTIAEVSGLTVGAVRKLVAVWQEWDTPTAAEDPTEPDPAQIVTVEAPSAGEVETLREQVRRDMERQQSDRAAVVPERKGNPWRDADGNPDWDACADEATQAAHAEASA